MATFDPFVPDFPLQDGIRAAIAARSRAAFRASAFYRARGPQLERWLRAIRTGAPARPPAASARPDSIRIAHWNIQQGKAWNALASTFEREPRLREADLITLNEVDIGMSRALNLNVAGELAERLGLHWAFVANYLELTKGPGPDRQAPGENRIGLHGLGILSRWPFEETGAGDLIECFDYFHFPEEKRYGRRRALWARIRHPRGPFILATTHLEVRNTPDCRARQIERALCAIPPGPAWFTGDWNTNTFRRRTLVQQAGEFLRLQRTPPDALDRELIEPWTREPLLDLVESAGFRFHEWNDSAPTARQVLSGVEELDRLPASIARAMRSRFHLDGRVLRMRLDWISARGPWTPSSTTGDSVWTLTSAGPDGDSASDHAPIGCEAVWTLGVTPPSGV